MRRAPELVSAEKAARRVVMLVNPGRKEWSAAAGLLYTGVQIMKPGEFTSAHRHQACDWEEKDIFALPSWAPHSHANASATEDAVLFSFDDFPAMRALALYREEQA